MLLDGLEPELHSGDTSGSGAGCGDRSRAGGNRAGAGSYGPRAGGSWAGASRLGSDGNGSGTGLSRTLGDRAGASGNGPGAGGLGSNRGGPGLLESRVEDSEGSGARSSILLLHSSTTEVDERLESHRSGRLSLRLSLLQLRLELDGSSGLRLGNNGPGRLGLGKIDGGNRRSRGHGTRCSKSHWTGLGRLARGNGAG